MKRKLDLYLSDPYTGEQLYTSIELDKIEKFSVEVDKGVLVIDVFTKGIDDNFRLDFELPEASAKEIHDLSVFMTSVLQDNLHKGTKNMEIHEDLITGLYKSLQKSKELIASIKRRGYLQ